MESQGTREREREIIDMEIVENCSLVSFRTREFLNGFENIKYKAIDLENTKYNGIGISLFEI